MKIVPKPEGFELREARADKLNDGRKWEPMDAVFDAYRQLENEPASAALLIAWYVRNPNGTLEVKFRVAYEHDRQGIALAVDLLREIQS